MNRVIPVAERNLSPDPCPPFVVAVATATDVLIDETKTRGEIAYRYITNAGNNIAYYAIGQDCSLVNYNGPLMSGQTLDASGHRLKVSVYSPAGTTISTTVLRRNDLAV